MREEWFDEGGAGSTKGGVKEGLEKGRGWREEGLDLGGAGSRKVGVKEGLEKRQGLGKGRVGGREAWRREGLGEGRVGGRRGG